MAEQQISFTAKELKAFARGVRAAARVDAVKAVEGEKVECVDNVGDQAYNLALDHAAAAILELKETKE